MSSFSFRDEKLMDLRLGRSYMVSLSVATSYMRYPCHVQQMSFGGTPPCPLAYILFTLSSEMFSAVFGTKLSSATFGFS